MYLIRKLFLDREKEMQTDNIAVFQFSELIFHEKRGKKSSNKLFHIVLSTQIQIKVVSLFLYFKV